MSIALGTQTGGSIIRPASFCGVMGAETHLGHWSSNEGAKPFAPSLDTIGWFGRSARDLALMLDVFDPAPPTALAPPAAPQPWPARAIAVWRTAGWPRAEAATREAMAAGDRPARRGAGARVGRRSIYHPNSPTSLDDLHRVHWIVMQAEGQRQLPRRLSRAIPPASIRRIAEMVRTAGGYRPGRPARRL